MPSPDVAPLPSRRKPRQPTSSGLSSASRRKTLQLLLGFVTLVLIINALVGERGLMETLRARRQHQELLTAIERLRAANAKLLAESRRLKTDAAAIEAIARQELGLIRPGELLFIIRDAKPASTSTSH